jgi:hypothetical protein
MLIFIVAVFLSSFLLFAVQPMMAKFLLPSFGGTAAVWAVCVVFFQTLLLAGYAYAHLLRTKIPEAAQRWVHLGVLAISLLFLPPAPVVHLAPEAAQIPLWALLRCLLTAVALPFFALSATAPLLMEWFRQSFPGRSPDRLYAFSNAGSLLALLSYPVLLEPSFSRVTQSRLWAGGVVAFFAVCVLTAYKSLSSRRREEADGTRTRTSSPPQVGGYGQNSKSKIENPKSKILLWLCLPACGSGLLLALTNQISQDVAPMPLLWVAPMSVYLLTFILCFEGPRSYVRQFFIPACFLSFLLLAWLLDQGYLQGFWLQVGGYLAVLFCGCMVCHGELYRLRPEPERLTAFYLAIALGGAIGGGFVAILAPALFNTLLETPILAVAIASLTTWILWQENAEHQVSSVEGGNRPVGRASSRAARDAPPASYRRGTWTLASPRIAYVAFFSTLIVAASLGYVVYDLRTDSICFTRNFYGPYRVKESSMLLLDGVNFPLTPGPARVLLSGQIYHGLQFLAPDAARIPTTYYCEEGGLGLVFRELPVSTNRNIGAIGLGAGTLAAYGRAGDHIRFYELNPAVSRLAQTVFTYLSNSAAQVEVVLGDGRLSLQREPDQHFDLLVLDAFAGDSIPVHLLTDEAMALYLRHIKPDGVIAIHISNSHLELEPVVRALADKHGLIAGVVPPNLVDPKEGKLASMWMILSTNRDFFNRPGMAGVLTSPTSSREPLLWTDNYTSILPILH